MRLLVTGSRHLADRTLVERALDARLPAGPDELIVVHGGAPGADRLAKHWAIWQRLMLHRPVFDEEHCADWERHGRSAGPRRNQQMVDLGADVCVAFPGPDSRGTWDCVRRARAAGIEVVQVTGLALALPARDLRVSDHRQPGSDT